jgi:hypothetical protein
MEVSGGLYRLIRAVAYREFGKPTDILLKHYWFQINKHKLIYPFALVRVNGFLVITC